MKFSKRFFPQSIRSRLALSFTVAFGFTLILTSALCYQIFVQTHQENFDESLYNHAIDVASAIDLSYFGSIELHPFAGLAIEKKIPFAISRSYLALRDTGGKPLAFSNNVNAKHPIPFSERIRSQVLSSGVDYSTIKGKDLGENSNKTEYRVISYLVNKPGLFPVVLQIAVPLTTIQEDQKAFFILLLILIPSSIALATLFALWASRRAFSPVLLMTKQTAQIEVKNLKERIQVVESDEELRELGKTLNLLLDRVEGSVLAQDRFVADASHQLKTPLAIIQGELELLSAQYKNRPEVPELNGALDSVQQEVTQLIRLVENLLLLARMDAGYGSIPFHTVRLDEIVTESVKRFGRVAEKHGLKISFDLMPYPANSDDQIDFEFQGESYLLRSMVENLLDNAIKYSTGAKEGISVRLSELSTSFVLEVQDHGLGITEKELADLFQRFQRDPKKSLQAQGSGLGLVIVKRIAELHNGFIELKSEKGQGTVARVEIRKS